MVFSSNLWLPLISIFLMLFVWTLLIGLNFNRLWVTVIWVTLILFTLINSVWKSFFFFELSTITIFLSSVTGGILLGFQLASTSYFTLFFSTVSMSDLSRTLLTNKVWLTY